MERFVNQRVEQAIEQQNISLNKLASMIGYTQSKLYKQLKGDTSFNVDTLRLIALGLPNVSAEWLLRGEGDMIKPTSFFGKVVNKIEQAFPCGNASDTSVSIYEDLLEQRDRRIRELEIELAKVKHSEREMMVATEGNPIKPYNA